MKKIIGALFLSVFVLQGSCVSAQKIDIDVLETKLNEQVQLLDVRTSEEFDEGYIRFAVNSNVNGDDFISSLKQFDKTQPIYVYCRTGNRSNKAAGILKKQGFKKVYVVEGGYTTWQNALKEVEIPLK